MLLKYTSSALTIGSRDYEVNRLAASFERRGVSKHTARAWAEAETPEDYSIYTDVATSGWTMTTRTANQDSHGTDQQHESQECQSD